MKEKRFGKNAVEVVIHFEGLRYGPHTIDLLNLGKSLQGFAKILISAGYFASTGHDLRRYVNSPVKVTTSARLERGSIDISAEIYGILSGVTAAALYDLIKYLLFEKILNKHEFFWWKNRKEPRLNVNELEAMALRLSYAKGQALSPIGNSCETISIIVGDNMPLTFNMRSKEILLDKEKTNFRVEF